MIFLIVTYMIFLSAHWTSSYDIFDDLMQLPFDPVFDSAHASYEWPSTTETSRAPWCEQSGLAQGVHSMVTKLVNAIALSYASDETIERKIK